MKVTTHPAVALLLGAILVGAGCQSVDARIRQNEATFRELSPAAQERVRTGDIRRGDPADMVLLAYGEPHHRDAIITSSGRSREVWTYTAKRHVKESSAITNLPSNGRPMTVEDVYRVYEIKQREFTLLDQRVIAVRDHTPPATTLAATRY